jgi:beta-lactamase class A
LFPQLPKYLPKETVIAHKTGEIGTFSHDAGIVYTKHGPYIIVIFSDSDIPKEAEETIARLSQATYAFFEGD